MPLEKKLVKSVTASPHKHTAPPSKEPKEDAGEILKELSSLVERLANALDVDLSDLDIPSGKRQSAKYLSAKFAN